MKKDIFSKKIISWYELNKRDLPWRNIKDPYKIWLSEVILQQTRVAQGLPYYQKFIEQFPTIKDLALANEQEVLRLWQGLGYYSRARNMHATARYIVAHLGGVFPANYAELLKLKGIGTYTAAAIASFAFNEKVAVLDGNVFRVLARVFGETTDISSNSAKKIFGELANNLLPNENADSHNQAIMEFGAMQCTPANPDCMFCVFSTECVANRTGQQAVLPIKTKKVKVRNRFFNYLVIEQAEKIRMKQRDSEDIWAGLFDFPLIESSEKLLENDELLSQILTEFGVQNVFSEIRESVVFKHILSHQRIEAKFWHLKISPKIDFFLKDFMAYSVNEIDDLPKPILINNYLKKYHNFL